MHYKTSGTKCSVCADVFYFSDTWLEAKWQPHDSIVMNNDKNVFQLANHWIKMSKQTRRNHNIFFRNVELEA